MDGAFFTACFYKMQAIVFRFVRSWRIAFVLLMIKLVSLLFADFYSNPLFLKGHNLFIKRHLGTPNGLFHFVNSSQVAKFKQYLPITRSSIINLTKGTPNVYSYDSGR